MHLSSLRRPLALFAFLILGACAHTAKTPDAAEVSPQEAAAIKQAGPTTSNDLDDSGKDLNAIPMDVNRLVLEWIDYFQGKGREHMERYLSRSSRYVPMMKQILAKQGLPEDLVYIALIESGFSPSAHSSANAVGYWQFIRATGKNYGLQIDSFVDERRDFEKATVAAADYFKGLYNLFGSWYLAIASYNVGENRIKNLVMKYHTRDFWELAEKRKLPKETINYVPKFLAARMIAKEPEKYGFTGIDYQDPLAYDEVILSQPVDLKKLADTMKVDYVDLKDLNPAYKRAIAVERDGRVTLRVPKGNAESAQVAAAAAVVGDLKVYAKADDDDVTYYRVRRGETLSTIARKFRTSTRHLRQINGYGARTRIIAGKKIKVPNDSTAGADNLRLTARKAKVNENRAQSLSREKSRSIASNYRKGSLVGRKVSSTAANSGKVHIVKPGESLLVIAQRYGVSLSRLASHNDINRRSKIMVGARLEIP